MLLGSSMGFWGSPGAPCVVLGPNWVFWVSQCGFGAKLAVFGVSVASLRAFGVPLRGFGAKLGVLRFPYGVLGPNLVFFWGPRCGFGAKPAVFGVPVASLSAFGVPL